MALTLPILLVLLFLFTLPFWRHSRNWGYGPSGIVAFALVAVLMLVRMGDIPHGF
jgi:uncharacterized protein DUF3309